MYTVRYKSHHDASRALKQCFEKKVDKKQYVEELLNHVSRTPRVIYIHVPFCNKVCSFCPFHRPDELKRSEYDTYLIREMNQISKFKYMEAPIDAINFGGGTPTALKPKQMANILNQLKTSFDIKEDAEISVETSISELTDDMIAVLKEKGVNRLSIGVQTFYDAGRKLLGRRGNKETAIEKIRQLQKAGFQNIGIDLIYNYPEETMQILAEDLKIIQSLELAGISFYSLMLHEKTPLYRKIDVKQIQDMQNIQKEKQMFDYIIHELSEVGYKPFELTKYIRNNLDRYDYMRIRHSGGSCIAIGHGAGGNLDSYVYRNSVHAALFDEQIPISSMGRVLQPEYFILDEFINDLQKMTVDIDTYSTRLGFDILPMIEPSIERMVNENLLTIQGKKITLLQDGIFWGNNIIDEFIRYILKAIPQI